MVAKGFVQTVLGAVKPDALGLTLTHEHVLVDMSRGLRSVEEILRITLTESSAAARVPEAGWEPGQEGPGTAASWLAKWDTPITLENLHDVKRNFFYYGHTYRLLSVDDAIYETRLFKLAGGGCIVDATVIGMARDPVGLQRVSRATGIHLVMTAGYYYDTYHPPEIGDMSEDQIFERIVGEVERGASGVFPGMIKAVAPGDGHPQESKVLRAAARAQAATGLTLTIHPRAGENTPLAAIRAIEAAGGNPTRTVMQHLDSRFFRLEPFLDLAKTGCYLSLDSFGREDSTRQRGPIDLPNDATRLNYVSGLAERGHEKRLLISHDCALKTMLHKGGGFGYDHIPLYVVPLMRYKGFSKQLVTQILVENPRRMLTIGDPEAGGR